MASCDITPHVHVRELLHQVQPSLWLLILYSRVCGCTATAVDGLWGGCSNWQI
jgi:hypothetical protein